MRTKKDFSAEKAKPRKTPVKTTRSKASADSTDGKRKRTASVDKEIKPRRKTDERSKAYFQKDRPEGEAAPRKSAPARKSDERSKAYFKKDNSEFDAKPYKASTGKKTFERSNDSFKKDRPDFEARPKKAFADKKPYGADRPTETVKESGREAYKKNRSFTKNKTFRETAPEADSRPESTFGKGETRKFDRDRRPAFKTGEDRPVRTGKRPRIPFVPKKDKYEDRDKAVKGNLTDKWAPRLSADQRKAVKKERKPYEGTVRLNRYIANAGLGSRREADLMIESGQISVNDEVISIMGYKVNPGDVVKYNGQVLKSEPNVYVLLNKPKDYISTTDDPQERKTVLSLVERGVKERIYPVGRLDRNTTGVMLLTNDGELTTKLTHPSSEIRKVYHVELDEKLSLEHFEKIKDGIELEDGLIKVDDISYLGEGVSKREVLVTLHSGKNHIVRRIFEHFEYRVVKLDRTMFAGLTRGDLKRGGWRYLTDTELGYLRMLTNEKAKKPAAKRAKK